ncbi:MAG: hypothetical protein DRO06_03935, partial [Thermoproteota archaeon]
MEVLVAARPLREGALRLAEKALSHLESALKSSGVEVEEARVLTEPGERARGPAVVGVATGGTERIVLSAVSGVPAVLAATPLANSLPAALEVSSALRERGQLVRVAYFSSWSDVEAGALLRGIRVSEAASRLLRLKIGSYGGPSDWLVSSWLSGLDVRVLPLGEVLGPLGEPGGLGEAWSSVPRREVERAYSIYLGMKRSIEENGLDAVTVRCFDLLEEGVTACLALALLNSEGVVAGCEGDLRALFSMALLSYVSGRPAWMANPISVEGRRIRLAHCTFPLAEAVEFGLTTHYESGLSVGIAATPPEGSPVTMLRVSGDLREALL